MYLEILDVIYPPLVPFVPPEFLIADLAYFPLDLRILVDNFRIVGHSPSTTESHAVSHKFIDLGIQQKS